MTKTRLTKKLFPRAIQGFAIALTAFAVSALANDNTDDSQGSSYRDSPRAQHGGPQHRRGDHGIRKIVKDYVAEKKASGEIDSYEFDVRDEKLALLREEMKAAREIKDSVTMQAKREEIRVLREEERKATRELVESNPELQQRIRDQQVERQERRKMRREDMQEFREFREQKWREAKRQEMEKRAREAQ